jgi:hypothetical protein
VGAVRNLREYTIARGHRAAKEKRGRCLKIRVLSKQRSLARVSLLSQRFSWSRSAAELECFYCHSGVSGAIQRACTKNGWRLSKAFSLVVASRD